MRKGITTALCAVILAGTLSGQADAAQSGATVDDAFKAEKSKTIFKREPRAQELIPQVEARIAQLKANPATQAYGERLASELLAIQMFGAGESETRLKEDIDLLQAATGGDAPPSDAELKALQEQYVKLVSDIDDRALVKDFERLLKKHDRFVRYTSLGLWGKDKIASELQAMADSLVSAPDIAFGRAESLRGLQDRQLASVPNLVYVGTSAHEETALSPGRRSVGILEEGLGTTTPIESADLIVQNKDGNFVDLSTPNSSAAGLPFAPPLSLWMKTRMLEGRVPAINFKLPPNMTAQDVIDGKIDDYIKRNISEIANTKGAVLVGLFSDFDQDLAAMSFGDDGTTPFYMFDPKLSTMTRQQAAAEYEKRASKSAYASPKALWPDLSSHYGDKSIPDGPERVRDAWKHVRKVIGEGFPNIAYYSTAGTFHGSKYPLKAPGFDVSGTQAWNKLEYYWPGDGVLNWIGINAIGSDPTTDPKGPNLTEAVDQFFVEASSSSWKNTPVMLVGLAPISSTNASAEAAWITTVFQKLICSDYPSVSMVLVDIPRGLTLWSREANSAYRTHVTTNKNYKWPLRFKMLGKE